MFEDIIGETTTKRKCLDVFENTDCCPYCGSEEIGMDGTYSNTVEMLMFCAICSKSWLVE